LKTKHGHLNQTEAAELLGIDQPKVSRLLRGQLKEFSMTRLLVFMLRLDRDIEIRIKKHRSSRVPPSIEVLAS
jgi:predicted XRE-type DNA-binding protein